MCILYRYWPYALFLLNKGLAHFSLCAHFSSISLSFNSAHCTCVLAQIENRCCKRAHIVARSKQSNVCICLLFFFIPFFVFFLFMQEINAVHHLKRCVTCLSLSMVCSSGVIVIYFYFFGNEKTRFLCLPLKCQINCHHFFYFHFILVSCLNHCSYSFLHHSEDYSIKKKKFCEKK